MDGTATGASLRRADWPPPVFWLLPLTVAGLRAIPFFLVWFFTAGGEDVLPPVIYNPLDWFAYVGFVREAADTGAWLLTNPHTTLPQDGRYILPLFAVLGHLARWTGIDPFWILELSRIPLIFVFFGVIWYFLAPIFPQLRPRWIAAILVGFSGGIESIVWLTLSYWPAKLKGAALEALSDDQGWNTFAALNNPLWIAGLTLALVALRPLLNPAGKCGWREGVQVSAGFFAAYYVHPYSGLVVLGVAMLLPVVHAWFGVRAQPRWLWVAAVLSVPLALMALISIWQTRDDVFRQTATGVLGDHELSVFWYPITLGALGLLAVRGWAEWHRRREPARLTVGPWLLILIFMHTSPLINGFHFVFHLHIPICILAAVGFEILWQASRSGGTRQRAAFVLLVALLLQSCLAVTWRSIKRAGANQIPKSIRISLLQLAQAPPGRVYTSPTIGTMVPAFTPHDVYLGHWFLTPNFEAKQEYFREILEGRADPAVLVQLIRQEAIDYVLLPPATPAPILNAVRPLATKTIEVGAFSLFFIRK